MEADFVTHTMALSNKHFLNVFISSGLNSHYLSLCKYDANSLKKVRRLFSLQLVMRNEIREKAGERDRNVMLREI